MSSYEWVIEQESPDGVTTRIVFDFADGDDDESGRHHRINNGSRYNGSSSSQRRIRGGRSGRGQVSAHSQSSITQQPLHQQQQSGISNTGVNPLYVYKDTAARSEGGSSKRSSKRSNGSRSRHHHHRHSSTSGYGGSTIASNSSMLTPAGSAYTSAALRQRYHRMLFGDRGNSGGASVPVYGRFDPSSNTLSSLNFYTRSSGPITHDNNASNHHQTTSPPPNTIFLSAYGAELVDEEDQLHVSYPPRRSCASTNGSDSSGGNSSGSNAVGHQNNAQQRSGTASNVPWVASAADSAPSHTTVDPPSDLSAQQFPRDASESPTRPSFEPSDASAMDYVDDSHRYCRYVKRDVWAARATCPHTITTSTLEFPAFPPLHPIPLSDEDVESDLLMKQGKSNERTEQVNTADNGKANSYASTVPNAATTVAAQQPFRVVSGIRDGDEVNHATAHTAAAAAAAAAAAEDTRRYNKMLLRKERQRGRGRSRGWQTTTPGGRGWDGEELYPSWTRGNNNNSSAYHRSGMRSSHCRSDKAEFNEDADSLSASLDSDDADIDDDETSVECLSNPSSSGEDADAEALRADSSFSAKVLALAHRAGRERRKMEAREERQLQNELLRCEEALMTPPIAAASVPQWPTSPAFPPLTLATALRQRDNGFMTAGARLNGHAISASSTVALPSNTSNIDCVPSSFFISPIHQSVAAASATWTAGTQIQFLGQGGLSSSSSNKFSRIVSNRKVHRSNGNNGDAVGGSVNRRRGRSDDNEEDLWAEDDESVVNNPAATSTAAVLGQNKNSTRSPLKYQARRARKLRKKGSEVHQSVVPECGGSRALRPVAPPSLEPPLELLPCSKKEMCEDMLESFLMAAVLEDDEDLKLP